MRRLRLGLLQPPTLPETAVAYLSKGSGPRQPTMQIQHYILSKIIGKKDRRRTRMHTERGDVLPFREYPAAFQSVLNRLFRRPQAGPWIAPAATAYLDKNITRDWKVFEFGCGASTIWLSARAGKVFSLEHDAEWHDATAARLATLPDGAACNLSRVSLNDFAGTISQFPDASFDLVLVDSAEEWDGQRLECLKAAASKVKLNGLLVLDDSDRPFYRSLPLPASDWATNRFIGVKPLPLMAMETTVFRRISIATSHATETR